MSLERRRNRLRAMLQEEQDQLEAELKDFVPSRDTLVSQLVQKTKELRSAREERSKKVGSLKIANFFYKTFISVLLSMSTALCFCFVPIAYRRASEGALEENQPRVARGRKLVAKSFYFKV